MEEWGNGGMEEWRNGGRGPPVVRKRRGGERLWSRHVSDAARANPVGEVLRAHTTSRACTLLIAFTHSLTHPLIHSFTHSLIDHRLMVSMGEEGPQQVSASITSPHTPSPTGHLAISHWEIKPATALLVPRKASSASSAPTTIDGRLLACWPAGLPWCPQHPQHPQHP